MRLSRSILLPVIFAIHLLPAWGTSIDVVFYDNRFGVLDDTTGSYKQLGTLPLSISSGIAYMNGMLYLEDAGSNLLTVDPSTGASRTIGATGVSDTAAVFAGSQSGLFEVDFASNLYKIDPVTGKANLVGATGLAANNGAFDTSLSSNGSSLYYTEGRPGTSDELYQINITTGVALDVGSTGVTAVAGSAYVNGQLELYQYGGGTNSIFSAAAGSLNFTRDAALSVNPIDGGAVMALNSVSGQGSASPEPATSVLLGAGLLFFGSRGRRKRKRVAGSTGR